MRLFYLDACVLAKRYSREIGSHCVNTMLQLVPYSDLTCATLGLVELVAILVRKRNDGRLSQELFAQAMINFRAEILDNEAFTATSITDAQILASPGLITKHNLNATDAIILRSALDLSRLLTPETGQFVLWTSDHRLARAASSEGITVFDPEKETETRLRELLTPSA